MTPTRSTVSSWQALAASEHACSEIARRAELVRAETTRVTDACAALSGHSWRGKAYDSARERVDRSHRRNLELCEDLDDLTSAIDVGLSEIHYSALSLLGAAADAEADGCSVSDLWVVTCSETDAEDKVLAWASLLSERLRKLTDADARAARSIATAASQLPARSEDRLGFFPVVIAAADLALIAAMAAGMVSFAAIMFWVQKHMPMVAPGDLIDIFPSEVTSDGGPGEWKEANRDGMSERARAYEEQVSGSPAGTEYELPRDGENPVKFDGWDSGANDGDGLLIEGKGPGYDWMVGDDGNFRPGTNAGESIPDQLSRQAEAARQSGKEVEWRVAEPRVAEAIEKIVQREGLADVIDVKHVPAK